MRDTTQPIIQRIGETDQLYLQGNTPELALERASLRLELVMLSQVRQEQTYFLQEAIVLLEQGRVEFEEMPLSLYLNLSLTLAKAYMLYFEISQETRFALITQQILKPLTNYNHGDIYLFLAYASAAKKENALTQHWLTKYRKTAEFDADLLREHTAFEHCHGQSWFVQLIQPRLH
ncbi:hypothetical protein [Acinetobacter indicus]|uniref:hypothetical protein n=1 Tax=Acinetobacter indicus TaxID=756892 RepID=UPI003988C8D2